MSDPATAAAFPRSGFDEVDGLVWLPRLLDKARRARADALGVYLLFEDSPLDALALLGWRVRGRQIAAWLDEGLDDAAIAARIGQAMGADLRARRRWSRRYLLLTALFVRAIDADEGRLPPGPATRALTAFLEGVFAVVKVVWVRKR